MFLFLNSWRIWKIESRHHRLDLKKYYSCISVKYFKLMNGILKYIYILILQLIVDSVNCRNDSKIWQTEMRLNTYCASWFRVVFWRVQARPWRR